MILAYVDDLALVAKTEEKMKAMIRNFRRYIDQKSQPLNTSNDKNECFQEGRRSRGGWKGLGIFGSNFEK